MNKSKILEGCKELEQFPEHVFHIQDGKVDFEYSSNEKYRIRIFENKSVEINGVDLGKTNSFIEIEMFQKGRAGILVDSLLGITAHRLSALNAKNPCEETEDAIFHVFKALEALEKREIDRRERGVFGTNKP